MHGIPLDTNMRLTLRLNYINTQIGKPFPEIMRELNLYDRHLEIFETYKTYSRMCLDKIELYDGVYDTLTELKNHKTRLQWLHLNLERPLHC